MKKTKKMMALVLVAVMVMAMGMSALAATVEVKTSDEYVSNRTFKAYQVFNADWQGGKLTNLKAGEGINWNDDGLFTALKKITGLESVTDAASLATALDGKETSTGEAVAKVLKDYVVTAKAVTVSDGGTLADGYWIIIDETTLGKDDVANAALLQVSGDKVTINVKTDKPSVVKKIDGSTDADTVSTGLVDANNGQVGDLVPYVITSTVPITTYYDKYYMEFNDTVSAGLDISATDAEDKFSDYKVYVNDVEMDPLKYTLTVDATNRTIKVAFTDVKGMDGQVLKLTYNAKINANAVVGETGNPNTVTLKYTNSPDHSGDGEYSSDKYTSETPKDIVVTYLTGIELLKVDTNDSTNKLEGAEFKIEGVKKVSSVVTGVVFTEDADGTYYKLATGAYTTTAPTDDTKARYDSESIDKKFKMESKTETQTQTDTVNVSAITGADGVIKFNDLGAGTYTITEILAPDGYNLLKAPITVEISCITPTEISTGTETCTWSSTSKDVTIENGIAKITVTNAQGTTLPSTGGIGTTIFYVLGTILLLGAAILLIVKRRMSAE